MTLRRAESVSRPINQTAFKVHLTPKYTCICYIFYKEVKILFKKAQRVSNRCKDLFKRKNILGLGLLEALIMKRLEPWDLEWMHREGSRGNHRWAHKRSLLVGCYFTYFSLFHVCVCAFSK